MKRRHRLRLLYLRRVILWITIWPVVLGLRILWQYYPGVEACAVFWLFSLADEPLRWPEMGRRRRICYGTTVLGSLGNAVATLVNGGRMPVSGLTDVKNSLWVPLTDSARVVWLCDIYSVWGAMASLGDFFIAGGLLALIAVWILEKYVGLKPEAVAKGKRLPGVGIG